jgi:hypothetical protein
MAPYLYEVHETVRILSAFIAVKQACVALESTGIVISVFAIGFRHRVDGVQDL